VAISAGRAACMEGMSSTRGSILWGRQMVVVLMTVASVACRGSATTAPSHIGLKPSPAPAVPTTCQGVPGTPAKGTMRAQIDGIAWNAICVGIDNPGGSGRINFGGSDTADSPPGRVLSILTTAAIGTANVGESSFAGAFLSVGSSRWQAIASVGAGSVTISSLTDSRIVGTFSFELSAAPGTSGGRTINAGSFDLQF